MTDEEYPSVFWGRKDQAIHPPNVPLLQVLATELHLIGDEQVTAIKRVARDYNLDPKSRRKRESGGQLEAKALYSINKALLLELVASLVMHRLDTPTSSRANCAMRYQWPSSFAPPKVPDVTMVYGGEIVSVEVSAKKDMDDDYFAKELESSLNHMESCEALWTLLVTAWDLEHKRAREIYDGFCKYSVKRLKGKDRRIIPISTKSLSDVSAELAFEPGFQSRKKIISSKDMLEIFKALGEAIDSGERNLRDIWIHKAKELMQPPDHQPDPPNPGSSKSPKLPRPGGPSM